MLRHLFQQPTTCEFPNAGLSIIKLLKKTMGVAGMRFNSVATSAGCRYEREKILNEVHGQACIRKAVK